MHSIFVIVSLASAALAAPQVYNPRTGGDWGGGNFPIIPIVSDVRNGPLNGVYNVAYESGDGTQRNEQGAPSGPNGAVVQQGGWSFTFSDGTPGQFNFVADEGGYRVKSPLLPTPPPMPAHALEQVAHAERDRAPGIFHDGQYDPSRYGGGQASASGVRPQGVRPQGGSDPPTARPSIDRNTNPEVADYLKFHTELPSLVDPHQRPTTCNGTL